MLEEKERELLKEQKLPMQETQQVQLTTQLPRQPQQKVQKASLWRMRLYMPSVLLEFFCQNTDCQQRLSGNMQQRQMLDKENTTYIKVKKNTLGLVAILVQGKDKARGIN